MAVKNHFYEIPCRLRFTLRLQNARRVVGDKDAVGLAYSDDAIDEAPHVRCRRSGPGHAPAPTGHLANNTYLNIFQVSMPLSRRHPIPMASEVKPNALHQCVSENSSTATVIHQLTNTSCVS